MANFTETSTFPPSVYQIATTDPVQGGASGVTNNPLGALVNRTRWLYDQIVALVASVANKANSNSPTLTGSPTAPTAAGGDDSTLLSTTAFAQFAAGGVSSVDVSGNANVVLTAAQWGAKVILLTGVLTGNINLILPTRGDHWVIANLTTGVFSITAKTAGGSGVLIAQGKARGVYGNGTNILAAETDYTDAALLGAPTAPNVTAGDSSTKVSNTAFVATAITNLIAGAPTALNTLAKLATSINNDANLWGTITAALALKANAANAALTGIPTAPTAAGGTNTTQIASCAFVLNALAGIVAASTSVAGLVRLSTNAEALAGALASVAVTPAALASFPKSLNYEGSSYFRNPGGMVVQCIMLNGLDSSGSYNFSWPLTFPTACVGISLTNRGSTEASEIAADPPTTTGGVVNISGTGPGSVYIIGIGG